MPEPTIDTAPDEFTAAFGEPLSNVLNMQTWRDGADLTGMYDAMRQAVADSVAQQNRTRAHIREAIFPTLRSGRNAFAPENAGNYQMTVEEVAQVHQHVLFNGATECCDGTVAAHDSLLLSIVQIGISLVAYQGSQGTWVQRLYRRDLRAHMPDPAAEALALLERRGKRSADDVEEPNDPLSRLVRRALMEYAERAALAQLSHARWRMGHGSPIPADMLLLTGTATKALQAACLQVLRQLLLEHKRFVYIVSSPNDKLLLTIGDVLRPLEFAIVDTLEHQFQNLRLIKSQRVGAEQKEVTAFMDEVGPQIVTGVYRAAPHAPARVFYAHRDYACEAAAIAIADSTLQPYRGFPMLIDLADIVCGNTFDGGSFSGSLQDAYAAAGEPTRYLSERETRS